MVVTRSASRSQKGTTTNPQPPSTTTTKPKPRASTSPSAPPNPSPTAAPAEVDLKARTIAHMNKDHTGDMSAILQHRARLSAAEAQGPEMLDLDLTSMTVRSASGVHTVALDPPMDTWDDRRARLADMSSEARRAALEAEGGAGAPSSTGAEAIPYLRPRGADWVSFAGLTFYWASCVLVYGGFVAPGSLAWDVLDLVRFPYGPVGYIWTVRKIFALVVAIHAFESFYLDRSRLAPAGLRRGSKVWLLWVAAGFFEGLPAYRRWDRLVVGKGLKSE